jgi:hypothetical protein
MQGGGRRRPAGIQRDQEPIQAPFLASPRAGHIKRRKPSVQGPILSFAMGLLFARACLLQRANAGHLCERIDTLTIPGCVGATGVATLPSYAPASGPSGQLVQPLWDKEIASAIAQGSSCSHFLIRARSAANTFSISSRNRVDTAMRSASSPLLTL